MIDEWQNIPEKWTQYIVGVPGLRFEKGKYQVHRTHKPLLPDYKQNQISLSTFEYPYTLRPYQVDDVKFMRSRSGVLNANPMRSGKTCEAISSHDPSKGPLFVVGPLASRYVWNAWYKRRFPNGKVINLTTRTFDPDKLEGFDFYFINYDILNSWQPTRMDLGTIVFDEAHFLTNGKSKRTQAAGWMATRAQYKYFLTGTPIWNRPVDIYHILHMIAPGAWGSRYQFAQRYADATYETFGYVKYGTSNEEELQARMSEILIRRSLESIVPQLPQVIRTTKVVELEPSQLNFLEKILPKKTTAIAEYVAFRRQLGIYKIQITVDTVTKYLDDNSHVIVWTWHKNVAETLAKELNTNCITGDTDISQREKIISTWKEFGGPLILTLGVGQTAIDLSEAKVAVFAEVDYTPAVIGQAEMRGWSPDHNLELVYITTNHPVDALIVRALRNKVDSAAKMGLPAAESSVDLLTEVLDTATSFDLDAVLEGLFC